jgi:hypothetical protein
VRSRAGNGFAKVDSGVVGWVNGGEPVNGCDLVSLMVFAPSKAAVKERVREIGLWSPYVMDTFGKPSAAGVAAAMADPDGFVWNDARSDEWWPSATLPRREQ